MRSERNAPKMENQQLVSPSRQCFSTPVDFGWEFLNTEQCDNTGAFLVLPWPASGWFLHFPSIEINIGRTALCDATNELKRLPQNYFQECFQHCYSRWEKRIFRQGSYFEGNVAQIIVLLGISLEIKWFCENFYATMCYLLLHGLIRWGNGQFIYSGWYRKQLLRIMEGREQKRPHHIKEECRFESRNFSYRYNSLQTDGMLTPGNEILKMKASFIYIYA